MPWTPGGGWRRAAELWRPSARLVPWQRAVGASGKPLDDIESTRTAAGRTDRRPFPLALGDVTVPAPVSSSPRALPAAVK